MLEAKAFLLSPAELGVLISLKHTKEKPAQSDWLFKIATDAVADASAPSNISRQRR